MSMLCLMSLSLGISFPTVHVCMCLWRHSHFSATSSQRVFPILEPDTCRAITIFNYYYGVLCAEFWCENEFNPGSNETDKMWKMWLFFRCIVNWLTFQEHERNVRADKVAVFAQVTQNLLQGVCLELHLATWHETLHIWLAHRKYHGYVFHNMLTSLHRARLNVKDVQYCLI